MPATPPPPTALTALLPPALEDLLAAWGEARFRGRQVFEAIHRRGRLDPAEMTTLPVALRERLARETLASATSLREAQESADGTQKLLLGLRDGRRIETVLIPEDGRRTVCVSSQVGCPMGCVFCASGVGGLVRNLTTAEIVEQPIHVLARTGARPTHVVVMGMGEPLLNLPALADAIRIWRRPEGWHLSPRRVTVSTASTGALIDRLREADLGVHLAVSLHGPDDETRGRLVPTSRPGRVAELVEAAARYARETGRDATVEYVLIAGQNDGPEQADALGALLAGRHIHANLIPLNPIGHRPDLEAPLGRASRAFLERVRRSGASATLRTRRGEDIAAACGQLALERSLPAEGE